MLMGEDLRLMGEGLMLMGEGLPTEPLRLGQRPSANKVRRDLRRG